MWGMTCEQEEEEGAKFLQIPLLHPSLRLGPRESPICEDSLGGAAVERERGRRGCVRDARLSLLSSLQSNLGGRYKLYSHNIVSGLLESSLLSFMGAFPSSFVVYSSFYRNAFYGRGT